jgi:hypothetical protein
MDIDLSGLWYTALHARVGLIILTDAPTNLRSALYSKRAELKDPRLDALQVSVVGDRVWIVKKNPEIENGQEP